MREIHEVAVLLKHKHLMKKHGLPCVFFMPKLIECFILP